MYLRQGVALVGLVGLLGVTEACPVLSGQDKISADTASRTRWQQLVVQSAAEADLVAIVRVLTVRSEEISPTVTRTHPTVELIRTVKGDYADEPPLFWDTQKNVVTISCDFSHNFTEIQLEESFEYLVFSNAGEILHASRMTKWPPPYLSADEERAIVEGR
jgi:hypothetical protein